MLIDLKNGISLNIEIKGNENGYPILFLHGNGEDSNTFSYFFDKLSSYKLIFIDSRCHGKSTKNAEISYELMRDDVLELVEILNLDRYSLVGFSDGAIISILMSLETNKIDKMFLIGPNLSPLGLTDECISWLKEEYEKTGSNLVKLCLEEPSIDPISLQDVRSRAIVIAGQFDMIREDHLSLIAKSFRNSALYTIPNATHFIPMENREELYSIIENELMINVYYEDNHVIVVEKEAGILSQEDESRDLDLLTITKAYLKKKYHKEGNVYLGLVQRLDRNVSGLMAFAKTSKAAARLNQNRPKKHYLAVVYGLVEKKKDTLINYIAKDEEKRTAYESEDGKIAILKYEVLDEKEGMSLLDIEIETGRFHQIRFQLSSMGHPIYNDYKYGGKNEGIGPSIGLDAYKVTFTHPTKDKIIEIERKPDRDIFKLFIK